MRYQGITTIVLTVALLAAATIPVAGASPLPELARTLPDVEQALLLTLQADGLTDRIVRIAADTNGHLTIAALTITHNRRDGFDSNQAYLGRVVWASLMGVPLLDELHVMEVEQAGTARTSNPELIFSAAISREEFQRLSSRHSPREIVGALERVWYSRGRRTPQPALAEAPSRTIPDSQRVTPVAPVDIYRGDPTRRSLALTFDDGPFPIYTTLLLDTLDQLGVKATFFIVGENVQEYPFFAQAIVRAGHEVANHSFHHPHLTQQSEAQMRDEVAQTQNVIAEVTGRTPRYFRPPYGQYSPTLMQVVHSLGLSTVFWTASGKDYTNPSPEVLKERMVGRVDNGGILLLHMGVAATINALPLMTGSLRQRGFTMTTVSALRTPRRPRAPRHPITPPVSPPVPN
jgi:peptidoglycan/xylan/chitin deacetylase (PgdA/CDA1 family)